jgi:hypothetical protein
MRDFYVASLLKIIRTSWRARERNFEQIVQSEPESFCVLLLDNRDIYTTSLFPQTNFPMISTGCP